MGFDYQLLKTELETDPLLLGYVGAANDTVLTNLINAIPVLPDAGQQKMRKETPTWEIFEAVVKSEYNTLSTNDKNLLRALLSMGSVNIQRPITRLVLGGMFGVGTGTRDNLKELQLIAISRAEFLGFPRVTAGDIERMRVRLP